MADYDLGLRALAELLPAELASLVFRSASIAPATLPDALTRETQLVRRELRMDKLISLEVAGTTHLVHVEFQTRPDFEPRG